MIEMAMKKVYADQLNSLLQHYHFDVENNPQGEKNHFAVLQAGIKALHSMPVFTHDQASADALMPYVVDVVNGFIPEPIFVGV